MSANGPPPGHVNDPENLIDEAFEYFKACATDYLVGNDNDDEEPPPESEADLTNAGTGQVVGEPPASDSGASNERAARAERLRITLCDLLKIVSIALEADDNAQVIFETLNARGTPLLALDLTKNAVFAEAEREGCGSDALYEDVWKPQLDDDYWRRDRRQGRLNRPIGELFLMHWLTMKTEELVPATELFATFRKRILSKSTDAEALIRELCADAGVMRAFDNPPPKTPEAEFFARMGPLDAGTVLPIVLLLFRSPEITVERRRRALRILESWLTRRALMRLTAKNYNRLVPRLVGKMKVDLEHADNALLLALSGGEGEISRWPTDEELREFLVHREVYGWVAGPRLVMALAGVEVGLYTNKTDVTELPQGLTIEHVIPQTWETDWPLVDHYRQPLTGDELDEATERRTTRINRIGNLTLVTGPLNSALSNDPWQAKRVELNKHTRLLLNARLIEHDTWDEQKIDDRTAWITERIIETWPGPDSAAWPA